MEKYASVFNSRLGDLPEELRTERVCRDALLSNDFDIENAKLIQYIPDNVWTEELYDLAAQLYLKDEEYTIYCIPFEILNRPQFLQAIEKNERSNKAEELKGIMKEHDELEKMNAELDEKMNAVKARTEFVVDQIITLEPEFDERNGVGRG